MKPNGFEINHFSKVFSLILFFFFVFFGFQVFAQDHCDLDGWNNSDCTVDIYYEDPTGGSDLSTCEWKVGNNTDLPDYCSAVTGWGSACPCSGSSHTCSGLLIEIGSGKTCSALGTNTCQICSKATDIAGNEGYSLPDYLNIDYQPPETTIQCNGEDCLPGWYNTDVSVALTCSDGDSGCDKIYYCKGQIIDCIPVEYPYTGPVSFDFTAEGTNYVRYYSTDIAGNSEATTSQAIKIDKTGPQSEFTDIATPPASSTVANDFDVSVNDWDRPPGTADIDNSGLFNCYYSVYDSGVGWTRSGATRNCNSDSSFTVTVGSTGYCRTVGGTCTVYVYAHDNAFNYGSGQSRTFNISEGTPPDTILNPYPTDPTNDATPTYSGVSTDDQSNVVDIEYRVDESPSWQNVESFTPAPSVSFSFTTPPLTDGEHLIEVRAQDEAGNWEQPPYANDRLTIDTTPPIVGEISPLSAFVNVAETFSVDVSDNIEVINCQLYIYGGEYGVFPGTNDGDMSLSASPCPSCTASKSHTFNSVGEYYLYALCADEVGNYNSIIPVKVTVIEEGTCVPGETEIIMDNFPSGDETVVSEPINVENPGEEFTGGTVTRLYAAGDMNRCVGGNPEYFDAYVVTDVDNQITYQSCTGYEDCTYHQVGTNIDITSYISGKTSFELKVVASTGKKTPCPGTTLQVKFCLDLTSAVPDTIPPVVGEISPLHAVVDVAKNFSAEVSDNIAVTNCQLFVDGVDDGAMSLSASPCSSCTANKSHTFTIINDYSLYARCRDQAGNYATGTPVIVHVTAPDSNPPTVEVIADPPEVKAIWQNTDAVASVSCDDTEGNCDATTYKLKSYSSSPPALCPQAYSEYDLDDFYTVDYHQWVCGAAKDFAGNEGFSDEPVEFKVDQREPSTNFVPPTPAENSWHRNDFTAKVMDSDMGDSGLKSDSSCEYKVIDIGRASLVSDYRPCGEYSFNVPVGPGSGECQEDREDRGPDIGQPTCRAITIAYDNAGNSKTVSRDFRVDYTPPTVGEIDPRVATQGAEETFAASLIDEIGQISGCWLYIDNWGSPVSAQIDISPIPCSNGTGCAVSANYTFTSSGDYEMRFACRDLAGNYGWGNPVTVSVTEGPSPHAPVITSLSYYSCSCSTPDQQCTDQFSCCTTPTTQSGCCVKFNITATDPDGDPLTYEWLFGDGSLPDDDEDPYHPYSNPNTYNVIVWVSDGTNNTMGGIIVPVSDPTLLVNLTANPAFGIDSLSGVSLRAIVSGSMFGKVSYYFDCDLGDGDCTDDGIYSDCDQQAANQITTDYTTLPLCNYPALGDYIAKVLAKRGTGSEPATAEIKVVSIELECEYGEYFDCTSPQGCSHRIYCQEDGTWPSLACPNDQCTIGEVRGCGTCGSQVCDSSCTWGSCSGGGVCSPGDNSPDCPCPPSVCVNGDYYEYPEYGNCTIDCVCEPCELNISEDDERCNQPPTCEGLDVPSDPIMIGDNAIFTGYGSDSDGNVTKFEFDFGDEIVTVDVPIPDGDVTLIRTHSYEEGEEGDYCVKLRVQDDGGLWSEDPGDCPDDCAKEITVSTNQQPIAAMSCDVEYCDGWGCYCNGSWETYNGGNDVFKVYNESWDPDDNIIRSTWSIIGYQDPYYSCEGGPGTPEALCNLGSIPIMASNTYNIKLVIEDEYGATSSAYHLIRVKQDAIADFMCSLTNEEGSWQDCDGLTATEGEIVYFKDSLDLPSHSIFAEDATVIVSRTWKRNDTTFASGETNPNISVEEGSNTIQLTITDDMNRSASQDYEITGRPSLPEWREIPPL